MNWCIPKLFEMYNKKIQLDLSLEMSCIVDTNTHNIHTYIHTHTHIHIHIHIYIYLFRNMNWCIPKLFEMYNKNFRQDLSLEMSCIVDLVFKNIQTKLKSLHTRVTHIHA